MTALDREKMYSPTFQFFKLITSENLSRAEILILLKLFLEDGKPTLPIEALQLDIGMPRTSFYRATRSLEKKGFLRFENATFRDRRMKLVEATNKLCNII